MDSLSRFYALVLADLRERVRSARFRFAVAILAALTWACFPPNGADYMILGLNGTYRGAYSSAWIGMVLGMLTVWVALVGFYAVRGTIRHDLDTRVWELLETSVLSRRAYLLAKWTSHMAVFGLFLGVQLLVGLAAQWVRAEDRAIDLVELVKPLLLLGVPSLAVTAMCAIWFDVVPWLRNTAGNVLYFALWIATVIVAVVALQGPGGGTGTGLGDPRGITTFHHAVDRQLAPQLGNGAAKMRICLGCGMGGRQATTLAWRQWQVTQGEVGARMAWLGMAIAAVLLCRPFIDRAASRLRQGERAAAARTGGQSLAWLTRLLAPLRHTVFGTLVAAELELALRRRPHWWWAALAAAAAIALLAPMAIAALAVIAVWALMIGIFARAGLREADSGMAAVVFSAAGAVRNVLLARWLTLVVLAWLPLGPALVRFAVQAPLAALAMLAVGMALATWALVLAALCRSPQPYELLASVLAYLGLNGAPVLDVTAAPATTLSMHAAALALAAAVLWPAWQAVQSGHGWPLARWRKN
jgi:hypothetical protein